MFSDHLNCVMNFFIFSNPEIIFKYLAFPFSSGDCVAVLFQRRQYYTCKSCARLFRHYVCSDARHSKKKNHFFLFSQ